ncbi:SDR family oxidoreductase [Actinoallomurus purpureus]|uniref:SDR family oxidoreductase n=1 Tax=Actinoallomurus purpureus TaxID=478114 RepID=UPI002092818D|nr:SDR family oxidoreductase [Actinoallomurus purpureus]MCO6007351.1 SDR family oxidoreductase [Actinoallomurus purpureus]
MGALDGKRVLVTGGSRGIGRAIVERLAVDGADVVFGYRRDKEAAGEVAAATGAHAVRADVAVAAEVEDLYRRAESLLGPLDVLVNNAAVWLPRGRLAEASEEDFDAMMAVNAKGTFLALRYAAERLRDGGRVVNLSSVSVRRPTPGNAVYAASKAAVEQFTAVAALELGARGITVNCIAPGATDTAMLRESLPPRLLARAARNTILGRLGTGEDIAGVVAFLVGPDSGWITGQTISATGGLL